LASISLIAGNRSYSRNLCKLTGADISQGQLALCCVRYEVLNSCICCRKRIFRARCIKHDARNLFLSAS